ncbi:MAG: type VI secretion system lipoprotein TssJ [Oleiphilus sp.]
MQSYIKLSKYILVVFTVIFVAGCSMTREMLDLNTDINMEFYVSSTVNPDSDGRSSPIVVNLLYLRDNRQFEQEDFIALLESPEDRLGKDLIETIRLKEFIPSEVRDVFYALPDGVKYVGIVAEFIQYQDAKGTLILPIEAHSGNDYTILLEKDTVRIED